MRLACGMTINTVLKFKDVFLSVLGRNPLGIMLVTAIAAILGVGGCMACFAGGFSFCPMMEGEGMSG